MIQRLEAGFGESPEVGGVFSRLGRMIRFRLPLPPAGPVAACFHVPRVSKHWKEVSWFFQGLEAGFGKSSKDWKRVSGGAEGECAEKKSAGG